MSIAITLRVLRGPVKTALQRISGDQAAEAAARLIIERCLAGTVIYAPDRVPQRGWDNGTHWGQRGPGEFGVSEPYPHTPPPHYGSGRCRMCDANDIDALGEEVAEQMWKCNWPKVSFADAGEYRATFLFMAHRAIHVLSGRPGRRRDQVGEGEAAG